jgi:hypothetical protein
MSWPIAAAIGLGIGGFDTRRAFHEGRAFTRRHATLRADAANALKPGVAARCAIFQKMLRTRLRNRSAVTSASAGRGTDGYAEQRLREPKLCKSSYLYVKQHHPSKDRST